MPPPLGRDTLPSADRPLRLAEFAALFRSSAHDLAARQTAFFTFGDGVARAGSRPETYVAAARVRRRW